MRARILLAAAALAAGSTRAADCPAPDVFVKAFLAQHPEFEREDPDALRDVVAGPLHKLLQAEWKCTEGHTKPCHLNYHAWTGLRDGGMLEPVEFAIDWQAEREATVAYTFWIDTGGTAQTYQRTGHVMLVRGKRGCWRVSDFMTPNREVLSQLYKRPLRTR